LIDGNRITPPVEGITVSVNDYMNLEVIVTKWRVKTEERRERFAFVTTCRNRAVAGEEET
jgi:hypothetical protein